MTSKTSEIAPQAGQAQSSRRSLLLRQTFSPQAVILCCTGLLALIGLLAIFSASSLKGAQQHGDTLLFVKKQLLSLGTGALICATLFWVPLRWLDRLALPLLGFTLVMLLLVFVPGAYKTIGGAPRWLNLPLIGGQPGEITKLSLVLFLAANLSRPSSNLQIFTRGILPNLVVLSALCGLLLVQRDIGTPVVLSMVTLAMLYAAGIPMRFLGILAGAGAFAFAAGVVIEPYRMARLLSFLDPWANRQTGGFQIIQSFLAFRNGGLFGVGLGESKQALYFLPEAHTDFVLAVIGEELGLFGVLLVLGCYFFVLKNGLMIARGHRQSRYRHLAFGLTSIIGVQALMNVGVVMGMLPTKGTTLPYVSYGPSSLLVFLTISGILCRLGQEVTRQESAFSS